jgi:5-methylcytosine-specific restriction enzyme subunit McrC
MHLIQLSEYSTTRAQPLDSVQRDALKAAVPSLSIAPTPGTEGHYDLTPAGTVGAFRVGEDLHVEIAPKLPIESVLFLVSYAIDPASWRRESVPVQAADSLVEALVPTFSHLVNSVLRRGLLHGYRTVDETSTTVRGRIRLADQQRIRPGMHLPLELTFDEFTTDILENRILRSATDRLSRLPLRHERSRRTLHDLREQFATITPLEVAKGAIPAPIWTRLNARYRPAVTLARLILSDRSIDVRAGAVDVTGTLFDMAEVFEAFVHRALQEALSLSPRAFPREAHGHRTWLDTGDAIRLKPDLSWWTPAGRCVFVGDCKYKRVKAGGVPNADLYQLLAYTTAFDLDEGMLIYAAGERDDATHTVTNLGKRLHVRTLRLDGEPDAVLRQVGALAEEIRCSTSPVVRSA